MLRSSTALVCNYLGHRSIANTVDYTGNIGQAVGLLRVLQLMDQSPATRRQRPSTLLAHAKQFRADACNPRRRYSVEYM